MSIKIFKGIDSKQTYTLEYNPNATFEYDLRTLLINEDNEEVQCDDSEIFQLLDNYFTKKRGMLS